MNRASLDPKSAVKWGAKPDFECPPAENFFYTPDEPPSSLPKSGLCMSGKKKTAGFIQTVFVALNLLFCQPASSCFFRLVISGLYPLASIT